MPNLYDCENGDIVRYNNRLYTLRKSYGGYTVYFTEYHIAKLGFTESNYAFFMNTQEHIYDSICSTYSKDEKREIYFSVVKNMKFVDTADISREYQDCLQAAYQLAVTHTITQEEIRAQETMYISQLREYLQKEYKKIAQLIYEIAENGCTSATIAFRISEHIFDDWNKYPSTDGIQRTVFSEFIVYLLGNIYTSKEGIGISDQCWMGDTLTNYLTTLFENPNLHFGYTPNPNSVFPKIDIHINISTSSLLL